MYNHKKYGADYTEDGEKCSGQWSYNAKLSAMSYYFASRKDESAYEGKSIPLVHVSGCVNPWYKGEGVMVDRGKPWCYTGDDKWGYCKIPLCGE